MAAGDGHDFSPREAGATASPSGVQRACSREESRDSIGYFSLRTCRDAARFVVSSQASTGTEFGEVRSRVSLRNPNGSSDCGASGGDPSAARTRKHPARFHDLSVLRVEPQRGGKIEVVSRMVGRRNLESGLHAWAARVTLAIAGGARVVSRNLSSIAKQRTGGVRISHSIQRRGA